MSFATDMAAVIADARSKLRQAPREVLAAVAADLVTSTPVETGRLRASWGVATGAFADASTLSAAGLSHAALDSEARDPSGEVTIARLQDFAMTIELGDQVSFVNSAPYSAFVEYGTAHMAPRAFMRTALARAPMLAGQIIGGIVAQP